MKIIWSETARDSLAKAIRWIKEDSPENARRVKEAVFNKLDQAAALPTRFTLDRFKLDNDGSYRAFETHNFRLAYRMETNAIHVLYFRHVHQNPLNH